MKTKKRIILTIVSIISIAMIAIVIYWFSMPSGQRNMISFMVFNSDSYDSYEEYQVIDKNTESIKPTGVEPVLAISGEDENNVNIITSTQMLQNEESSMLKLGSVQTLTTEENYTGWHVIADEGASEEYPFGPSPLSYYTAGTAANLHTAINNAAEVMGIELDYVRVEVVNYFYWDDMFSSEGTGNLKNTNTQIIIESNSTEEQMEELKIMAINAWTVGEALRNKTPVEPSLKINGDDWANYYTAPGTSLSNQSFMDDLMISSITDEVIYPEFAELTIDTSADEGFDIDSMSNLTFEIYAISESANNPERPQLKEVTIGTPTGETWLIYSDEFMSNDDIPFAPTSLEYFTVGTSLCLTSQTTLVNATMGLDIQNYRVEHQFFYSQSDLNSENMNGSLDDVQTYVFVESNESEDELEIFFNKSLSLCFAGEGLVNETEMNTSLYLNGNQLD